VKYPGHLFLEETILQPSAEWGADAKAWLFLRIDSGKACWFDPQSPFLLEPGDTLLAPPGHHGVLRASRVTAVTIVYFRFCPELLAGFLTLGERVRAERFAEGGYAQPSVFRAADKVSREFAQICKREAEKNGPVLRSRLLQMAVAVLLQPERRAKANNNSVFLPASKRVELLLRHLSEAELLENAPAELAARCGCSPRHLNKLFRALFGVSLRSRQRELKLLKARQMLAESNMRVAEIAFASGFRELGIFSMAFKKRFGMTPTDWRRSQGDEIAKNGPSDDGPPASS
jgi:AraC-like DNA-binding protein